MFTTLSQTASRPMYFSAGKPVLKPTMTIASMLGQSLLVFLQVLGPAILARYVYTTPMDTDTGLHGCSED